MPSRRPLKVLTRRQFCFRGGASLIGWAGGAGLLPGNPQETLPDGQASKGMITPGAQRAINSGLEYLAINQRKDGSFGTGQHTGNVAITSLAALAMMAGGYQPVPGRFGKTDPERFGQVVTRALEFVLSQEDRTHPGYLHNPLDNSHGPMYGHGFGTLFLAEVLGMVRPRDLRERTREALRRAVDLIVKGQNPRGGWRYQPGSRDADISVTICQIMALRSARNAGFSVPKNVVDRCIAYVKSCQDETGGFRYMDVMANGAAFARTAAGVAALFSAGVYKGPEVDKGLEYLMRWLRETRQAPHYDMHYFYGHYYAVQAMWTAGGAYWTEWFPTIREELLRRPRYRGDGSWSDQICIHYGTAMACIILQVPNNYLPILQK